MKKKRYRYIVVGSMKLKKDRGKTSLTDPVFGDPRRWLCCGPGSRTLARYFFTEAGAHNTVFRCSIGYPDRKYKIFRVEVVN